MVAKRGKQAYRENERQPWPAWIWLGLGVLLGLALSALVLIKDWAPMLRKKNLPQPNADATAPKESEQAVADEAAKKPAPPVSCWLRRRRPVRIPSARSPPHSVEADSSCAASAPSP